jgi:signal transduction histidine kinase/HAMP domain-containing protein
VPTGPRWGARGVTYRREVVLALLLIAVVPLAVFGFAAFRSVEGVVAQEALGQARTAIRGVSAVLARDAADLNETTESYATWPVLQDEVARLDLESVLQDVVQFQLDQGEADVVVLIVGDRQLRGGPPDAAAELVRLGTIVLSRTASPPTGPVYADLGDGVYLVAFRPIDLSGRTGPGVDAANGSVGLAFGRRLDPAFVTDAGDVSGFDGAVFGRSGKLLVASDQAAADAFKPDTTADPAARPTGLRAGMVGGSMSLTGLDGQPEGWYVATLRTGGIETIGSRLLPLLAVGLGLAVAAAAVLAALLGRRLRRRIDTIEGGLSAMAAGDLDVRLSADNRDEIGRLATSLDRMGETLARRDRILRDAIAAVSALTPDRGVERVEADGVAAAARIFDLDECRLEDLDLAAGPKKRVRRSPADDRRGLLVSTELGPITTDGPVETRKARLVGRLPPGRDWSEADQSLLDVFARLLRAAVDDAAVHARALDRADRLSRLARLQGDFLRGVSHNLQAPLTNIVVVSDELATADTTDAHAREGARVIRAEADRLARLVGQLLTLSRLESGTLRVEAEPVAPAPIIQRVWASLRSDRPFQLDDDSAGMVAVADRAALEQVAWMLLDNALKYAPSGPIRVSLEPSDREERIAITVWDNGPGIVPEERARVFRRFERGSTSEGLEGTGLGLDVARGLVRAMGGTIRYVPNPDGGAGFRFTVPGERSERPV